MFRKDVRRLRLARIVNIDLGVRAVAILSDNVRRMACARDPHLRRIPLSMRMRWGRVIVRTPTIACEERAFAVPPAAPLAAGFHAISATTTGSCLIQERSWPTRPACPVCANIVEKVGN